VPATFSVRAPLLCIVRPLGAVKVLLDPTARAPPTVKTDAGAVKAAPFWIVKEAPELTVVTLSAVTVPLVPS